jgi:hypothetical protein
VTSRDFPERDVRDILSTDLGVSNGSPKYLTGSKSWRRAMSIVEHTSRRLVLTSGATKLALDKDLGRATMQRKFLFWNLRPVESSLGEVADVIVDKSVDRASGAEFFHTVLITTGGAGWTLPAADQDTAQTNANVLRSFLGLSH